MFWKIKKNFWIIWISSMFVVQAYLKTALLYSFIYKGTFMAFYYIVSSCMISGNKMELVISFAYFNNFH